MHVLYDRVIATENRRSHTREDSSHTGPYQMRQGKPDETRWNHMTAPNMDPYGMFVFGGIATQRYFEGSKIFPVAVVVSEYSFVASHYSAVKSLSQWLEE